MKKYCQNNIGTVYCTNDGYKCEVIDGGRKSGYVTAKIRGYIFEARMSHIRAGAVKYPFHPSVYNVGYFGVGKYSAKNDKLAYTKWHSMIRRCYSTEYQKKKPTYINCSVDKRWHNFQTFAKWYYKYYPKDGIKYELDKDIRVPNNKIYSSHTCMFTPQRVNVFMTNVQLNNTSGHTGVSWYTRYKAWQATIRINGKKKHLGCFTDINEASKAYREARAIESAKLRSYYSFDYTKEIIENIR